MSAEKRTQVFTQEDGSLRRQGHLGEFRALDFMG